jgi:hypothetical protein
MDRDPNVYDRETRVYDRETPRSSNTLAYLIGGLVIAVGLLAFLFWDGGGTTEPTTTGSTVTNSEPAPAATPKPATPATPATPAAPATPAPAKP